MQVVDQIPSLLIGAQARVYRFTTGQKNLVVKCFPKGEEVTVSFYARTISFSEKLRVFIETPYCSQTKDFDITNEWERCEISLQNDISLMPLSVFFTSSLLTKKESDIAQQRGIGH